MLTMCPCPCQDRQIFWNNYFNGNLTQEEKNWIISEEKERIKRALFLDKSVLSSNWRRKRCIIDNRPTAVSVGVVGVVVLCTVIVSILFGDIASCCRTSRVACT